MIYWISHTRHTRYTEYTRYGDILDIPDILDALDMLVILDILGIPDMTWATAADLGIKDFKGLRMGIGVGRKLCQFTD